MSHNKGMTTPQPELEKTWGRVLRVWWAIIWRLVLMQLGVMAVAIYTAQTALAGYPFLRETLSILSLLTVFPLGLVALRKVINKNFGAFRLSCVPLNPPDVTGNIAAQPEIDDKTHA